MEYVEQTALTHILEQNHHVRWLRAHAHQQHDVRVPQQRQHSDFVGDLVQQLVSHHWVKYHFGCTVGASPGGLLDHTEATLTKLVAECQLGVLDL